MRTIIVLVLLLISSVQAPAADCHGSETTLCSNIFSGSGICDGTDQVSILAPPWEPLPIEIVGVAVGLKIWGAGDRGYIFAGNSYSPDVMLFHVGDGSETVMFPKGLSFYLPTKMLAAPITLPPCPVSSALSLRKSVAEPTTGVLPKRASRTLIL